MKNSILIVCFLLCSTVFMNFKVLGQDNEPYVNQEDTVVPEFILTGQVKDANSKKKIYDATVTLKGSDGTEEILKTNKKGKYIFNKKEHVNTPYLMPNTTYTIEVKKTGYKTAVSTESTKGAEGDKITYEQDFLLQPKEEE